MHVPNVIFKEKLTNFNNLKKVLIRVPVAAVEIVDDPGQGQDHVHVLAHEAATRTVNVATAGAALVQIARALVENHAATASRRKGRRIAPSQGKLFFNHSFISDKFSSALVFQWKIICSLKIINKSTFSYYHCIITK